MPDGNFSKVCITLRGDQVKDLKSRSRNLSKMVRDAIDYYLTLDIGSSDIAIYEIRRDVKKLLEALSTINSVEKSPKSSEKEVPPVTISAEDLGPLKSIIGDEKDEKVIRTMLERGHENSRNLVDELGYKRTESIRDKLNSLNKRAQEKFGRPLFRYFRSRDGFDYSWWLMVDLDELQNS